MKKLVALLAGSAVVAGTSACSPAANRVIRTVLDVFQIGCIQLQAESDDATIQKACGIADELIPDLRKVVAGQRAASRKFAAEHAAACPPAPAPQAPAAPGDAGVATTPAAKDGGKDAP